MRHHPAALAALDAARRARRLAGRLASWSDVDIFGCMIAGQAYREGALGDAELARWRLEGPLVAPRGAGQHGPAEREGAGRRRATRAARCACAASSSPTATTWS